MRFYNVFVILIGWLILAPLIELVAPNIIQKLYCHHGYYF